MEYQMIAIKCFQSSHWCITAVLIRWEDGIFQAFIGDMPGRYDTELELRRIIGFGSRLSFAEAAVLFKHPSNFIEGSFADTIELQRKNYTEETRKLWLN